MIIASVVLGLGACGSKSPVDDALNKMEDYKKQVCACKDMACAEKVSKEMETYMDEMQKKHKDVKPSKEQDERADKIGDEMEACMNKLTGTAEPAKEEPAKDEAAKPAE